MNDPKSTQEFKSAALHDNETAFAGSSHLASDSEVPIPAQEGFGFSGARQELTQPGSAMIPDFTSGYPREERDGGGTGALNWDPDLPPQVDAEHAPTESSIPVPRVFSNGIEYAVGSEADGREPEVPWEPADAKAIANRTAVLFLLECAGGEAGFVVNPMHLGHKIFAMIEAGLAELSQPRPDSDVLLRKTPAAESLLALADDAASGMAWREKLGAMPLPDPNDADALSSSALLCDAIGAINAIDEAVTMGTAQIGNQIENARGVLEDIAESLRGICKFANYVRERLEKEEAES